MCSGLYALWHPSFIFFWGGRVPTPFNSTNPKSDADFFSSHGNPLASECWVHVQEGLIWRHRPLRTKERLFQAYQGEKELGSNLFGCFGGFSK